MALHLRYQPYTLHFVFEAGTSRGVLTEKTSWLLHVHDPEQPEQYGLGECGPLVGLSVDDRPDFEAQIKAICALFNSLDLDIFPFNLPIILNQLVPAELPSVRFGLEMALLDYLGGGQRTLFDNAFSRAESPLPINGLIWMGKPDFMQEQIETKLAAGFTTLKLKIGALDFQTELDLLKGLRKRFSAETLCLRVDANGAFAVSEALGKLEQLAELGIHSIEQPIKAGQPEAMASLIAQSPLPIALDEELIGIHDYTHKFQLLKALHPPFIILKPTLLGGFQQTKEWVEIARRLGIQWWITSALESNIGLNAIAQFTAEFQNPLPQGLGTGLLYHNNFSAPLAIQSGYLHQTNEPWEVASLADGWCTP